mmetsp:Transcript_3689/g.9447  ORF Transcript_3689/g.9447 Transcript_3689/m.9447 type:complete len:278 (+) Transcript_3689:1786-2619(+)
MPSLTEAAGAPEAKGTATEAGAPQARRALPSVAPHCSRRAVPSVHAGLLDVLNLFDLLLLLLLLHAVRDLRCLSASREGDAAASAILDAAVPVLQVARTHMNWEHGPAAVVDDEFARARGGRVDEVMGRRPPCTALRRRLRFGGGREGHQQCAFFRRRRRVNNVAERCTVLVLLADRALEHADLLLQRVHQALRFLFALLLRVQLLLGEVALFFRAQALFLGSLELAFCRRELLLHVLCDPLPRVRLTSERGLRILHRPALDLHSCHLGPKLVALSL